MNLGNVHTGNGSKLQGPVEFTDVLGNGFPSFVVAIRCLPRHTTDCGATEIDSSEEPDSGSKRSSFESILMLELDGSAP